MRTATHVRFVGPLPLLALLLLAACAAPPDRFEFGVIGDAPYVPADEARVAATIAAMNRADLAFVVHVGDLQADPRMGDRGGIPTATDASLQRRKELFDAARHPFILTPGDNDWTDCHLVTDRQVDPLERLARLRAVFFASPQSLGQRRLTLFRQSGDPGHAEFVENQAWTRAGVVFVTLHVVGSNDNRGRTPAMDAEWERRQAADLAWLVDAFARARRADARAVVVVMHANPLFETTWPQGQAQRYLLGMTVAPPRSPEPSGYAALLSALEREVVAFARPVLLIHGDTHLFRVDKPLVRAHDGSLIGHFTRLETFGHPDVHWIRVMVDPADPDVFAMEPAIVPG